jgi:hypothetical protein
VNKSVKSGGEVRRLHRRIRQLVFAVIALVAAVSAAGMSGDASNKLEGHAVVALIDGEPLTLAEFQLSLAVNRAKVSAYFHSKYGASTDAEFWTANYEGEVPLDKLRQDALADAVASKMPQIVAKENQIITDISYEGFLNRLHAENERRARAKRDKAVIFGPVRYSKADYYHIVNSNTAGELKKALHWQSRFPEEELEGYYQANKERYKKQDLIELLKISATGEQAKEILKLMKEDIDRGMGAEAAASKYAADANFEYLSMDADTARSDALVHPILHTKVTDLTEGGITDVFQENGAYILARCIKRSPAGYLQFHEVKEAIISHLGAQAYDRMIDERIRDADVAVNTETYQRIGMNDMVAR